MCLVLNIGEVMHREARAQARAILEICSENRADFIIVGEQIFCKDRLKSDYK